MKFLILILLFSNISIFYGQDTQYSQPYSAPFAQNPAFCGADICNRFTLTNRVQWAGISPGYNTFLTSFDHSFNQSNFSIGVITGKDISGSGDLKKLFITPIISYEIRLTRETSFRIGFSSGIGQTSLNYNNLIFGDQIARGGNVETVENLPTGRMYLDIGSGLLLNSKKYWIGISLNHLNKPDETLLGSGNVFTPIKMQIQGGYKLFLEDGGEKNDIEKSFTFATKYKLQANFQQLDFGSYYTYNKVSLGLWYRGIPFLSNAPFAGAHNDALIFIIGIQLSKLKIGYSYDITMSRLSIASMGSHEISLGVLFCNKERRRPKALLISCPKF